MLETFFKKLSLSRKVSFASDGQQVIELVKETFLRGLENQIEPGSVYKPIDLLILDFQMPMKNGIQVVAEIRKFYAMQTY